MATEDAPRDPTTSKSRNDLEILSLNYLRSQNISQIPVDDHIPKLHPCKLCNKAMFGFQFEALTILRCGHLLHRLCVETHIMRGRTKFPSCPTCKMDIEINREEHGLASGECAVLPTGKASQQSNITIDDDDDGGWEEMVKLGLIEDESPERTKQVNKEDRGTSPIANISVITQEQAGNEKGTTNLVQVDSDQTDTNDVGTDDGNYSDTQTRTSRQASPKITREQDKLQGILQELSTHIKGETDEDDVEGSEDSISQSLARLYQKASLAEKRVTKANQDEILCWYHYAEGFEKKVKEIMDNNKKIKDQQARTQKYNFIIPHLPGVTKENLRKKTQKDRNIYKLFKKIGVKKVKRVVSFSADTISKLTGNQIQSIIDYFTNSTVDHVI